MKVIDLQPRYQETYFKCLEDTSIEMAESGIHKACWYQQYRDKGLRVKLAVEDSDTVVGMIQYLPIEESFIDGADLYFILCIWVHGYKEGVGDHQGHGIGTALLDAAEQDARKFGAKGIAAWGLWAPVWMKASWFKKHGYKKADRYLMQQLIWKPFTTEVSEPHWIRPKKQVPKGEGRVLVTAFINGWCPAQNLVFERAKSACYEFGDLVSFRKIDTSVKDTFSQWGIVDGIYIDGKPLAHGPPMSYEKIVRKITKRVKRLALVPS